MTDPLVNTFGPLDGAEIPGGCEDCDAYQTVRVVKKGVYSIVVHHDADCVVLARATAKRKR